MKKTLLFLATSLFLFSCSKDDGKSNQAEILDLSVSAIEINNEGTYIDSDNAKAYVFINNNLNSFSFPLELTVDLTLSSGAKTASVVGGTLSFSNPDEVKKIVIEAEDGSIKNWYIYLVHLQLQNSGFENWFTNVGMDGQDYTEFGTSDVESLWSTANMGTSTYEVYGTQPVYETSNVLAKLTTDETLAVPITAATLFTGRFNIAEAISNPTDPKKATDFGIPFIFRPSAMKIKFKYAAGADYIQATLVNPSNIFGGFTVESIAGEDQCSIYAILEVRNGDQITEIARAQFDSGSTGDVLTETTIPFNYTSSVNPTHITVVFTSSIHGDLWRGAVGSTLTIDDLELIYE